MSAQSSWSIRSRNAGSTTISYSPAVVECAEHRVERHGRTEDKGGYTFGAFTSEAELLGIGLLCAPGHASTASWERAAIDRQRVVEARMVGWPEKRPADRNMATHAALKEEAPPAELT